MRTSASWLARATLLVAPLYALLTGCATYPTQVRQVPPHLACIQGNRPAFRGIPCRRPGPGHDPRNRRNPHQRPRALLRLSGDTPTGRPCRRWKPDRPGLRGPPACGRHTVLAKRPNAGDWLPVSALERQRRSGRHDRLLRPEGNLCRPAPIGRGRSTRQRLWRLLGQSSA